MSKLKADSAITIATATHMAQVISSNLIGQRTTSQVGGLLLSPDVLVGIILAEINIRLTEASKGL